MTMPSPQVGSASTSQAATPVAGLVGNARKAMAAFAREIEQHGQPRIDEAVTALAWSIYEPDRAKRLAEIAVEVTGIGRIDSKIVKNQRKTFGTLRDLLRGRPGSSRRSRRDVKGPPGVVAAITPSTPERRR
jgi:sulfoacetaldehyde dehydrogenase